MLETFIWGKELQSSISHVEIQRPVLNAVNGLDNLLKNDTLHILYLPEYSRYHCENIEKNNHY